jgi:hypothetical protein
MYQTTRPIGQHNTTPAEDEGINLDCRYGWNSSHRATASANGASGNQPN